MAIDFGRAIQGIATGAMGQFNAEVEAKDKMKGRIIEQAGLNFYENTLPDFEKKEKSRKETYDKLSGQFGVDVAEFMGQNNFITGDANDRSEEHTSELQSRLHLVCRLLLEKKKQTNITIKKNNS